MKKSIKTSLYIVIVILLIIIGTIAGVFYKIRISPFFEITETVYIFIDDRKDYRHLLLQLESVAHIKDVKMFDRIATFVHYPEKIKSGRYSIQPQMSCWTLLGILKNGIQTPCKITFNNIRIKQDLVRRFGEQLMLRQDHLLEALENDSICAHLGFNRETILCMFIPNTYEMYWNISVNQLLQRMKKEYDRFWTEQRLMSAQEIPLSPIQVSILASIVEEETASLVEYPIVSGLYINRLRRGMLLQADPTVKYAIGDFSIKRVLNAHLTVNSLYNTYLFSGLPPGPIRIPSIQGIESVLNFQKHHYLYMCAKADFSGRHHFATTLYEHNRNAERYRAALNQSGIRQ